MQTKTTKKRPLAFQPANSSIRSTYSAAVITAPGTVSFIDQSYRQPGVDQVGVKMEGVGLCASSIPVWEGREWFQYPLPPGNPGHEGWGRVVAIGKEVSRVQVGQRAAILSDRAFAEYCTCPENVVFPIPERYDSLPFPGEALGCLMNIFRRANIKAGQTVAIVGMGFIGRGLAYLCQHAGAKVITISRRKWEPKHGKVCADLELTGQSGDEVIQAVGDFTSQTGADTVIECTGKQRPLDLATELIKVNGRLVIAGFHQDGKRSVDLQKWNWQGIDVINAHERHEEKYLAGMAKAVKAIDEGSLKPDMLISHCFEFRELAAAMNYVKECPAGLVKAIVKF